MQYYHDLITQKSWLLLQNLKKKYDFVLIGGWAVYLYSRGLKSKDIDLILDYPELEKLKEEFPVTKNDRLRKYEARLEETEIDIYLPYYSDLGLSVEEIVKLTIQIEGFKIPQAEVLVLLKAKALSERKNSVKGRKDLIDLVSLFSLESFDFETLKQNTKDYKVENFLGIVATEIKNINRIDELDLNVHKMAAFKRKILPQLGV